jgi:hypothetical protein
MEVETTTRAATKYDAAAYQDRKSRRLHTLRCMLDQDTLDDADSRGFSENLLDHSQRMGATQSGLKSYLAECKEVQRAEERLKETDARKAALNAEELNKRNAQLASEKKQALDVLKSL